MLGVFTDPYPDELLYSVIARLQERLRYPNVAKLMEEVFGRRTSCPSIAFPCGLGRLIDALPASAMLSTDHLLNAHTLFPFYALFLPPEIAKEMRRAMIEGKRQALWRVTAKLHGLVILPDSLRYCVKCMEEDCRIHGEPYWHRLHQIPGVLICDRHREYLGQLRLPIREGRFKHQLVTAGSQSTLGIPAPINWEDPVYILLLKIAQDARWIVEQCPSSPGLASFRGRYLQVLIERTWALPTGRVKQKEVLGRFKAFCPPHALKILRQFGGKNDGLRWVAALTGSKLRVLHPYLHLLFCRFLGHTMKTILQLPIEKHSLAKVKGQKKDICFPNIQKYRKRKHHGFTPGRVDWERKDHELQIQILSTIEKIQGYGGRPVRLTPAEVWRHIDKPSSFKRAPSKFPLCLKILADSYETQEELWIRRIRWAADEYRHERHCPTRSSLLRRAGIRPDVRKFPEVSQVISEVLAELDRFPMLGRPVQRLLFDELTA